MTPRALLTAGPTCSMDRGMVEVPLAARHGGSKTVGFSHLWCDLLEPRTRTQNGRWQTSLRHWATIAAGQPQDE